MKALRITGLAAILLFIQFAVKAQCCGSCCSSGCEGNEVDRGFTLGNWTVRYEHNRLPPPPMFDDHIHIYNENIEGLSFSVSTNKENWSSSEIAPYGYKRFESKKDLYLRISTRDKSESFLLNKGNSYYIVWNSGEKKWDVNPKTSAD